jgi:hypothetical protein
MFSLVFCTLTAVHAKHGSVTELKLEILVGILQIPELVLVRRFFWKYTRGKLSILSLVRGYA